MGTWRAKARYVWERTPVFWVFSWGRRVLGMRIMLTSFDK